MKKYVSIDFDKCRPDACNGQTGVCPAVGECSHKLLEQEDLFDCPMLISMELCVGCGDCIRVCPYRALSVIRG